MEDVPRPPVWMMRQAGRHLPEYRKLREGKSFEDLLFNPELTAEVTLQPVRRYDLDAAIIFSDILLPFYGMDTGLRISPGVGPVLSHNVRGKDDVDALERPSDDVFDSLVNGLKIVRRALPNKAVIGFAGAPYTLSSYLIEGRSTRDSLATKCFASKEPRTYRKLLHFLKDVVISQVRLQIEQGVDFVQVFDSWAFHLSEEQYRNLVFPVTRELIATLQKEVPVIFYSRGSSHLLPILKELGARGYSIDHTVSLNHAREILPSGSVVQGNLDPAYLLAGGEELRRQVLRTIKEGMSSPGHIFNLAQGVNKETPVENVLTTVRMVKEVAL